MNSEEARESGLLIRYFQGETNEEENMYLLDWIKSSVNNEKLFLELKQIWDSGRVSGLIMEDVIREEWKKIELKIRQKDIGFIGKKEFGLNKILRPTFNNIIKIAAVFVLAFGISWLIQRQFNTNGQSNSSFFEFRTPKGAKSEINLPDGSKVWLNAESYLRFPNTFTNKNRKVYLEGEAYFDIKKDTKHPLIVETSDINIKVVGTSFNVKSYPGEGTIETTLERGKIVIENKISYPYQEQSEVTLQPNQRATFIKKQGKIFLDNVKPVEIIEPGTKEAVREERIILNDKVQTGKYTAWKDGKLIFDNETFENLAVKLERWYDIKIDIEDEALRRIRFTGTFENETIEQGLEIMKLTTPIKYVMDKNEVKIWLAKK
jgi:transmembrane sensor